MPAVSYLTATQNRLSQIMAECRQDNALHRKPAAVVLQHIIKDFQAVKHQSVITAVMTVAPGSAQVIAGADKINETFRTRTPDALKVM